MSDNLKIGYQWGNRNLAEVKFQTYILYSQDNKRERVSNLLLVVEARGFFRQQWALGSVFIQPWTPQESIWKWGVVHFISRSEQRYKTFLKYMHRQI